MRTITNILIILSFLASRVVAYKNVTFDDFDRTRITYLPPQKWVSTADAAITSDRYQMTTTYTKSKLAYATFNFTGAVAFYFMGYGGVPFDDPIGSLAIVFDNQEYEVPENIDLSRQAQQILFSRTRLDVNRSYSFTVRKITPDNGGHDLNVDAMILTVPEKQDPGYVAGLEAPIGNGLAAEVTIQNGTPIGAIVGGIVGGIVVGVLVTILLLWLRKRRSVKEDPLASAPYILPLHADPTSVTVVNTVVNKQARQSTTAFLSPPHQSTSSTPSPPRPSISSLPTHRITPSITMTEIPSINQTNAQPMVTASMETGPPPYTS